MKRKLSESLKYWRAERPDEWIMDEFFRKALKLEDKLYEKVIDMDILRDELEKCKDEITFITQQVSFLGKEILCLRNAGKEADETIDNMNDLTQNKHRPYKDQTK